MTLADRAPGRFAHKGEALVEQVIEALAVVCALAQRVGRCAKLGVVAELELLLVGVDLPYAPLVILELLAFARKDMRSD